MVVSKSTSETLPTVLVLLATFDGERFLPEQLRSVASQCNVRPTVLVRDDGSHDNTILLVAAECEALGLDLMVMDDELGPTGSAGSNFMAIASVAVDQPFDYFAFCDQDDIWLPDKLSRSIALLRASDGAGYSSNLTAFSDRDLDEWPVLKTGPQRQFDYLFQGASAGCTYVLTPDALRHCVDLLPDGRFPNWLSHDWYIYAACRARGLVWVMDDESHIRYRQHDSNAFGAKPGLRGYVDRLSLMRSGWYRNHILWLSKVLPLDDEATAVTRAVQRFNFVDRLFLLRSASQFRRRFRDRLFLRLTITFGLL